MASCANCNTEIQSSGSHEASSLFDIVDKRDKTTVLNVIAELFGVSDKLRELLQNCEIGGQFLVPWICQRCFVILKNGFKWRKQFLTLCHPEATLGSILYGSGNCSFSGFRGDNTKGLKSHSRPRLKKCNVVIKPLPHVYLRPERIQSCSSPPSTFVTSVKVEPCYNYNDFEDNGNEHVNIDTMTSPSPPTWAETCNWGFVEDFTCKPELYQPETSTTNQRVNNSEPSEYGSPRLRARFKCRHCFKFFSTVSGRDEHEQSHRTEQDEDEDLSDDNEEDEEPAMYDSINDTDDSESEALDDSEFEVSNKKVKLKKPRRKRPSRARLHNKRRRVDYNNFNKDLIMGMYEEIRPDNPALTCDKCPEEFPFHAHLMSHIASVHRAVNDNSPVMQCFECDFQSDFQLELTRHIFKEHTRETRFKCLRCSFQCPDGIEMRRHCVSHVIDLKEKATKGQCWTCPLCSVVVLAKDRYYVKRHVNTHLRPLECPLCDDTFPRLFNMEKHLRVIHGRKKAGEEPEPKPKPKNVKVNQKSVTPRRKRKNAGTAAEGHDEGNSETLDISKYKVLTTATFKCDMCEDMFHFHAHKLAHSVVHHSADKVPGTKFQCTDCDYNVKKESELIRHFFCHTKEKVYKCDFPDCEYGASRLIRLKHHLQSGVHGLAHMAKHADIQSKKKPRSKYEVRLRLPGATRKKPIPETWKKFQCDMCVKRFQSSRDCERHKTVHFPEDMFPCSQCSKTFRWKDELRKHLQISHNSTFPFDKEDALKDKIAKVLPVSTFKCSQCSQEFGFQAVLLAHVQVDHVPKEDDVHGFRCGLCTNVTPTSQALQVHYRRQHTKEMAFQCAYENCTYQAITSTEIRQHLKSAIHSTVPKLQCQFCGSFFSGQSCLDKHVKKQHI